MRRANLGPRWPAVQARIFPRDERTAVEGVVLVQAPTRRQVIDTEERVQPFGRSRQGPFDAGQELVGEGHVQGLALLRIDDRGLQSEPTRSTLTTVPDARCGALVGVGGASQEGRATAQGRTWVDRAGGGSRSEARSERSSDEGVTLVGIG